MTHSYRTVGQRVPRIDAVAKVTGKARYGVDQVLPGMLHGVLVRSTVAHARIKSIDATAALALPGVRGIALAQDVPVERYGSFVKDMEVLASTTVIYIGQPIVAIAARTLRQAQRAAQAVRIDYEPLPAATDLAAALAPAAPLVHADWADYAAMPVLKRAGNVSNRAVLRTGDIDAGFAASALIVENRYTTTRVHPGYTEPRAALAQWDDAGRLTVWSNTQLPFEAQSTLADIFAVRPSSVRVIGTTIGGGFGGKLRLGVEHYAALLARKFDRPVKMACSCEEEVATAYCRQPVDVTLRTGVAADGTILAHQARVLVDTGANSGSGVGVASSVALLVAGPYRLPNVEIEGLSVYTHTAPTGSFRAPAGPQGNFALESHIDAIAERLGMDPLDFRLKNILRDGDTAVNGQVLGKVSLAECLAAAAEAIDWRAPGVPGRGKGIACGWWTTTSGSSGVYVKLDPDGRVVLNTGCAEIGTGALTGACQVLAEALTMDVADIFVVSGDTASTPFDYGAQGSRTAFAVGNACLSAAAQLVTQAKAIAAGKLGVAVDALALRDGALVAGDRRLGLGEIAAIARTSGGGLIAHGTFIAPTTPYDPTRADSMVITVFNSPSFHAHAVDLAVDAQTGEVSIQDYVVAQDVGFAINPTYVEGQLEGGAVQGIGQALSEEVVLRDGRVLNPNLTDYKMPTAADAPPVRSILITCPSEVGPFGAKGVGEPPVIEPPATLANAIARATGKRLTRLPMTAEAIQRTPVTARDR